MTTSAAGYGCFWPPIWPSRFGCRPPLSVPSRHPVAAADYVCFWPACFEALAQSCCIRLSGMPVLPTERCVFFLPSGAEVARGGKGVKRPPLPLWANPDGDLRGPFWPRLLPLRVRTGQTSMRGRHGFWEGSCLCLSPGPVHCAAGVGCVTIPRQGVHCMLMGTAVSRARCTTRGAVGSWNDYRDGWRAPRGELWIDVGGRKGLPARNR